MTRPHRSPAGNSGPLGHPIPLQSQLPMDYYFITAIEKLLSFSVIQATSLEVTTITHKFNSPHSRSPKAQASREHPLPKARKKEMEL